MNRKSSLYFCAGLIFGVVGTIGAVVYGGGTAAAAQEKSYSKIVLENEKVRVKEAVFAPNDSSDKMHTHVYPHVGVVIDGGTLKFNYADGKTETMELPRGGVGYREANVTHQAVNPGQSAVRVIEVEIK